MSDMGYIQTATTRLQAEDQAHRRAVRLAALRHLTGAAATLPDPAGCAACGRRSGQHCRTCYAALRREAAE